MIQQAENSGMQVATSIEEAMMNALRSAEIRVRAGAIATAAHSVDPEALVDAVADQSDAVRRNAAIDALTRAGPRSVPTLIRALRHPDAEVVMFAAGILGKTRDASAIPHLVRLLSHEDVNVAQGAIESLGQLRAVPSVSALVGVLHRDPWLKFAAVHALGEIGDVRAVLPLEALLRQEEELGDAIVKALGQIGSAAALRVLAAQLLRSASDEDRFCSCLQAIGTALQQLPDAAALGHLEAWAKLSAPDASAVHLLLLKVLSSDAELAVGASEDLELKEATIEVVRALRLKPLYGALVRAARDPLLRDPLRFGILSLGVETGPALAIGLLSPDPGVRVLACECIGAMSLPEMSPQLERLLQDRDDEVRAAAVEAIAREGREGAVPLLVELLEDPSDVVSRAVATALKRLDAEAVSKAVTGRKSFSMRAYLRAVDVMHANPHALQRPLLVRGLRHADPELRRASIAALARHGAADLLDVIAPLLSDGAVEVRREAILALGQSRCARARDLLLRQIAQDPETRTYSIRTLGELGNCGVAPLLAGMLDREEPLARIAIIEALAELRDPAAEPLLVRALGDPEPEVRRSALDALLRFGTPSAVRHGLAAARDADWRVRAAAVELLSIANDALSLGALERLCFDESSFVAKAARRKLEEKAPQ